MKAPSPIAVIRSILGPEQAEALLRGGIAPESLARTVLEATAPADLAAALAAAGLEKAEPLSARTVLAVQNLVRLNQMRADRAIREVALGKAEKAQKVLRVDLGDLSHHAHTADGRVHRVFSDRNGTVDETSSQTFDAEGEPHVSAPDDAKTVSRHVQAALDYRKKVHSKAAPTGSIARAMNRQSDKVPFRKAERSPKLPPDQHGIGPKHEPEGKIAPTKQLEPQVHQNHGTKRPPATLEKRSKNVKEQTTGITKLQAHRRRQQYARSLGLDPQNAGGMAELRDLKGKGNQLKYGGKFDLSHELGHAMQTRPGGTLSEHMAGIAPDDQFDDDTINTALEHRIDRRAGVDPHKFAGEFRGTIGDPDYSPPDDDFIEGEEDEQPENEGAPPIEWNADLLGRHGRQNRTTFDAQERLQQQAERAEHANSSIARFDLGHRFDPSGKLRAPEGIDAKINRRAGILKSEIGRPVDVKTAKPEKVKKECPVYQHIRDAYQAENWSKARDLELRTEGNSTWIMHNGKGLKLIPGIGGGREKARAYIEAARQKALKETINKSDAAEWRSRPVLRAEDAQDLDHAAAARSLSSGSAQEGERQAYEEYSRQQRLDAMAHHFRQAGEAQKRGDRPTSERHMLAYAGHARALGIDPAGHPPPEVGERIRQLAGKKAAFRGHPADRLA